MNAQEHIEKAEKLLGELNARWPESSTMKIRAAEVHLKIAQMKYDYGEQPF